MALSVSQVATGSLSDLGMQEEVAYGQLPPSPNMTVFRRRSTTLGLAKDSYDSEEIRSDRMTSDSRHGVRRGSGDIVTEVSPGSHSLAWEAVVGGIWAAGGTKSIATGASINTSGVLTTAAGLVTAGFKRGDRVKFTGSSTAYDNKQFTVTAMTDTTLTFGEERNFTFTAVSFSAGTVATVGFRCGIGNILRSFLFERTFADIGQFIKIRGCKFNTVAVSLPPTGIATATWGVMAKDADPLSDTPYDGSAPLAGAASLLGNITFNDSAGTIVSAVAWGTAGFAVGDLIAFANMPTALVQNNSKIFTITAISTTTATIAEPMVSGPATTGDAYTVKRVGKAAYNAASTNSVLVAVSGAVYLDGVALGVVTGLDFTVDNGMAGSEVVGANTIPIVNYGNRQTITGTMTVLFENPIIYNMFANEVSGELILRLDNEDGTKFLQFYFPRAKFNTGTVGDAVAEGLPIECEFRALAPQTVPTGGWNSQIVVQEVP